MSHRCNWDTWVTKILWSKISTGADLFPWRNESSQWKFHLRKFSKNPTVQIIIFWVVKIPWQRFFIWENLFLCCIDEVILGFLSFQLYDEKSEVFMENQIRKCTQNSIPTLFVSMIYDFYIIFLFSILTPHTSELYFIRYQIHL